MSNNFASRNYGATRCALNAANEKIELLTKELADSEDTITRIQQANKQFSRANEHLAKERDEARAEVERLKGTRPAPCQHCGSTDPKRSAAFCKRCEWQQ